MSFCVLMIRAPLFFFNFWNWRSRKRQKQIIGFFCLFLGAYVYIYKRTVSLINAYRLNLVVSFQSSSRGPEGKKIVIYCNNNKNEESFSISRWGCPQRVKESIVPMLLAKLKAPIIIIIIVVSWLEFKEFLNEHTFPFSFLLLFGSESHLESKCQPPLTHLQL